jgi:hypothetical protein
LEPDQLIGFGFKLREDLDHPVISALEHEVARFVSRIHLLAGERAEAARSTLRWGGTRGVRRTKRSSS